MKNIKNKRALLFGGILCLAFAAIAITIAYNRDSSVLANNFELGGIYKTVTTEEFIGPDNWAPCQAVPKTVTVKNEGDIDVSVRISYEDYWKDYDDNRLDSEKDGIQLVNIVFQNESDWELRGGYYYYKHILAPGEESNSLFKEVVLNCDADLGEENQCVTTATGTECTKPYHIRICTLNGCYTGEYSAAKYHLNIKVETIQADAADTWEQLYHIVANSQGLRQKTEKGVTVSAFTGNASNNNVIWSNMCWQIVRTTYSGGTKMIFNGLPTTVNGAQTCAGDNPAIEYGGTNTFTFSAAGRSGYMNGGAAIHREIYLDADDTTTSFVLSNGVSRDGQTYTLDISEGQFIEGAGVDRRPEAQTGYHYFCTDGLASCDETKIGYLTGLVDAGQADADGMISTESRRMMYVSLGGYDSIDDYRDAIFANTNDSDLKSVTEAWFTANGLDDNDLEDAIFCNDRKMVSGSLIGIESGLNNGAAVFAFGQRTTAPTLDCVNKNDAFTKDDTRNGNGKLSHKVGALTADEAIIAGMLYVPPLHAYWSDPTPRYYLDKVDSWLMTPWDDDSVLAITKYLSRSQGKVASTGVRGSRAIRPVVSLKANTKVLDGDGRADSPYVVESH